MILKQTLLYSTLLCCLATHAQIETQNNPIDSSLAKKISIDSFCLCKTTLTELKTLDPGLKQVNVEEMDLCNDGFVQDGRFTNRKGFASEKYPGIIFQKEETSDFISKIRLTKEFTGKLPGGYQIDMHTMLAKDVFKINPRFATWGSRGCSDYWSLSNDTLLFFVKIDKSRIPQYPVNEAYYAEKPVEAIDLVVSCYSIFEEANHAVKKLFNDPVIFIDSVNVTRFEMDKYKLEQIAFVSVYKNGNAIKLVGPEGKDGVIYVETKKFARNRYWSFFVSKSPDYLRVLPNAESDSSVVYILNGEILATNHEASLAPINDKNFIGLEIIDKDALSKEFNITDKSFGIVIKTTKSKKK